jgi:hypothetical protein
VSTPNILARKSVGGLLPYCKIGAKSEGNNRPGPLVREEHRLRVFDNWVLRRIFGPKRDEVKGEWRKLHNEELHILYSKGKAVALHAMEALGGRGDIAPTHSRPRH